QPKDAFAEKINGYTEGIKNLKKAQGVNEIFIPGERKHEKENLSMKEGISLDENAVRAIDEILAASGSSNLLSEKCL
ncbi:MAG: Ldh family oxidoreductase, partial [Clostridiales bacterium]|nr:Ldh family oxidoreductase [Clostridiales bacterium]